MSEEPFVPFDYQSEALAGMAAQAAPLRACLYYKTGAGKSPTALLAVAQAGAERCVVVAPPSTHGQWVVWGHRFGVEVVPISHARFRMKDTKMSRHTAVIADEFHMFGGHGGQGWKKLDALARGLDAPLVLCSATPNYNDAERVYCVQHILDPHSVKGGYLAFLYAHCLTEQNPFGAMPKVLGFHRYSDAAAYLADLPQVYYLPDDLQYRIIDVPVHVSGWVPDEYETYGLNRRRERIVASQMEDRHSRINLQMINSTGQLRSEDYAELVSLTQGTGTPVLVFANHSTVARALGSRLMDSKVKHAVVDGKTATKQKGFIVRKFNTGTLDVLVGTASLATGTDGMDQVCDTLVILDDTDDAALRRQLVGRIMPRGASTNATSKTVYRLVLT